MVIPEIRTSNSTTKFKILIKTFMETTHESWSL